MIETDKESALLLTKTNQQMCTKANISHLLLTIHNITAANLNWYFLLNV